jgi:hypothetical protein
MLETFITDYIWYHAVTLTVLAVIVVLTVNHRYGSEKNLSLAQKYK